MIRVVNTATTTKIGIASLADTFPVSQTVSPLLYDGSVACCVGVFIVMNWRCFFALSVS
jgi:hypothetical protein